MTAARRHLLCAAAACAILAAAVPSRATPAVIGAPQTTEVRVAVARTPALTTVWTSVRIDDKPGPFALIVPLPAGAFVDQSSDAWFEALEIATAPRVFPPSGLSPYCPGASGPPDPFDIAGSTGHAPTVLPETITVADDAAAAITWATAGGLSPSSDLEASLAAIAGAKFLCVRYAAPGGMFVTPTLRIAAPKGLPALPFSITRAGASDVRVSAWLLGQGRGSLDGAAASSFAPSEIVWNAKAASSNYLALTASLLAAEPDAVLLESAGHGALTDSVPIANGAAVIEAVAPAYLERAAAYGNAPTNPDACISASIAALASTKPVGPACPRGDLAALAGPCADVPPGADQQDPAALLCGPAADDLAIAFTGAVPAATWLTRRTFIIPAGAAGKDRPVSFAAGNSKQPLLEAGGIDLADCFGQGTGGGSSTSSSGGGTSSSGGMGGAGASSGSGSGLGGSFDPGGTGAGGSGANGSGANGAGGSASETDIYIDTSGCTCGGAVVDSSDTDSSDTASSSGDDCGGDSSSSDSDSESESSSGDDCGGSSDSSSDIGDGGSAGDSGESTFPDPGYNGAGPSRRAADCAVDPRASAARRRSPRLSVLTLGALALLLPLRRRGRKRSPWPDPSR